MLIELYVEFKDDSVISGDDIYVFLIVHMQSQELNFGEYRHLEVGGGHPTKINWSVTEIGRKQRWYGIT